MIALLRISCIILLLLLIALYKTRQTKVLPYHSFDTSQVLPIKGILCLLIIVTHITQKLGWEGIISWDTVGRFYNWAVPVVSCFFFFSGNGLTISYLKKGNDYLKSFFQRRVFKLLPTFIILSIISVTIKVFFMIMAGNSF